MHACIQIQALHQNFKMETIQSITQLYTGRFCGEQKKSPI